jgi:hypothetical protein
VPSRTKRTRGSRRRDVLETDDNSVRTACLSSISMPCPDSQFLNPKVPPLLSSLYGPNDELPILDLDAATQAGSKLARLSFAWRPGLQIPGFRNGNQGQECDAPSTSDWSCRAAERLVNLPRRVTGGEMRQRRFLVLAEPSDAYISGWSFTRRDSCCLF